MTEPPVLAVVAAGGALGSLGRWVVGLVAGGAAWGTLVVNVSGALVMGLLVAWLERHDAPPLLRPFVAVGVLGGWTTYSSFALETVRLSPFAALWYVLATLVLGLVAVTVGLLAGERLWGGGARAAEAVVEEEL